MSKIAYRPDVPKRKVMSDGELALNLYRPSNIVARAGDPQPFLDFMKFLIPDEKECYELLKWCATLVARPDIRMLYGFWGTRSMEDNGNPTTVKGAFV